ncbi:hypothetical protein [Paraburkholderia caledonica]|uniref:hypothetical protein n=1 Tax=Paraburkholderia caledonica TaxID=134536 RepID=UPI00037DD600|nr:hypothetical protein [Paraburkholderia caledonica]
MKNNIIIGLLTLGCSFNTLAALPPDYCDRQANLWSLIVSFKDQGISKGAIMEHMDPDNKDTVDTIYNYNWTNAEFTRKRIKQICIQEMEKMK